MNIEWIKIEGMMTAVNKDTGEIVNHLLRTLPEQFEVSECVEQVLFGEDELKPLIPTSVINDAEKGAKRGPKPKQVANPYASIFSNASYDEDTGACSLGHRMDDILYSIASLSTGNTRIPVKQLMLVLKGAEISTKGIQELLNKRRALKESNEVGERYARSLRKAAESVINRLNEPESQGIINLSSGSTFSFEIDREQHKRSDGKSNAVICPVEFTEGDKRTLRKFAVNGQDAMFASFVSDITSQCGRMMERIEGKVVPVVDVFEALHAEFPYEPNEIESTPVVSNTPSREHLDGLKERMLARLAAAQKEQPVYTNSEGEPW